MSFLLAGCGPGSIDDLSKPAIGVSVREGGGFCTSLFAVDGDDVVWYAQGCGDDSGALERRGGTVTDAERAELDALMDEVLALDDDPECELVSPSDRSYRFIRTADGADRAEARQCGSGIPPAALDLAGRLEAAAAPPVADAGP